MNVAQRRVFREVPVGASVGAARDDWRESTLNTPQRVNRSSNKFCSSQLTTMSRREDASQSSDAPRPHTSAQLSIVRQLSASSINQTATTRDNVDASTLPFAMEIDAQEGRPDPLTPVARYRRRAPSPDSPTTPRPHTRVHVETEMRTPGPATSSQLALLSLAFGGVSLNDSMIRPVSLAPPSQLPENPNPSPNGITVRVVLNLLLLFQEDNTLTTHAFRRAR